MIVIKTKQKKIIKKLVDIDLKSNIKDNDSRK